MAEERGAGPTGHAGRCPQEAVWMAQGQPAQGTRSGSQSCRRRSCHVPLSQRCPCREEAGGSAERPWGCHVRTVSQAPGS